MKKWTVLLCLSALMTGYAGADDPVVADEAAPEETAHTPRFIVLVPERVDHIWNWLQYADESNHIAQGAIEKALIRAQMEVVDLSGAELPAFGNDWRKLQSTAYAVQAGRQLNADYVIAGQASAVKGSENRGYGVTIMRASAEISVRIIRVSDSKILDVLDASSMEGGQSVQAAGQAALKEASKQIAGKITRAVRELKPVGP
jgi:hypothetical protein